MGTTLPPSHTLNIMGLRSVMQMLRLIQLSSTTMPTGSHTLEPMELTPTLLTPTQPTPLVTPLRLLSHIPPRLSCQPTLTQPTHLDSVCCTSAKLRPRLIPTLSTPTPMDSTMDSTMDLTTDSHTPLNILATHTHTTMLVTHLPIHIIPTKF